MQVKKKNCSSKRFQRPGVGHLQGQYQSKTEKQVTNPKSATTFKHKSHNINVIVFCLKIFESEILSASLFKMKLSLIFVLCGSADIRLDVQFIDTHLRPFGYDFWRQLQMQTETGLLHGWLKTTKSTAIGYDFSKWQTSLANVVNQSTFLFRFTWSIAFLEIQRTIKLLKNTLCLSIKQYLISGSDSYEQISHLCDHLVGYGKAARGSVSSVGRPSPVL